MTTYYVYPKFIELALTGLTIKGMLLKSTFGGFDAAHDYVNDISASEVDSDGYARQTIAGALTSDANGAYLTPSAAYIDFPVTSTSYTAQYLAIIADTGDDATSKVIGLVDFGEQTVVAQKLRITFAGALIEGAV